MRRLARPPAEAAILAFTLVIGVFLLAPLGGLAWRSVTGDDGAFTLARFAEWAATPGTRRTALNTVGVGAAVCALVIPLAFLMAYALERSGLRAKGLLGAIASAPLLAPSLLPALALVYLFGRQGLLTPLFGGQTIYGPQGILIADAVSVFPHAVIILRTALRAADGRHYEQARLLGASAWRSFLTLTLPAARHGLISAAFVVFALTVADVGAPKVVGGDFDVLALDIYKQVLGQQNFDTGAVIAMALLAPSLAAIGFERWAAARQAALVSARSTPFVTAPGPVRDGLLGAACGLMAVIVVGLLAVCQLAALVRLWPYDLTLTGAQYDLDKVDGGGWSAIVDSIALALTVAAVGTACAFAGAYVTERTRPAPWLRAVASVVALAPAAAPGLALGLAYVLFFNDPYNPLHGLYGTFAILVAATVTHFYTVAHLTSVSALKALDPEIEPAAALLGRGGLTVLTRIAAPLCAPALVEIAAYLFVNAMTTVSVVVFLYPPDVKLAAVAVLNMDDAGDSAPAAAMGMLIVYVNLIVRVAEASALRALQRPSRAASPRSPSPVAAFRTGASPPWPPAG
jgi:iron(III) transport system permease protein